MSNFSNNLYNNNSLIKELTPRDFVKDTQGNIRIVGTKGKMGFVVFYADWCGHCKSMVADYNQLAKLLQKCINSGTIFLNVFNCNNPGLYKEIAEQCGVEGYPTIKFVNMEGDLIPYDGPRSVNDFLNFFTQNMPKICQCTGSCK